MKNPASIFIDARTVRPGMSGVGRYAYNILAALAASNDRPRLRAMFPAESMPLAQRDPALDGVELIAAPFSHENHPRGDLWLEYKLPKILKADELYHGPAFLIPGGRRGFVRVVTIHDLFVFTHPWAYPKKFALWLRWVTRRACRRADLIIVPSQVIASQVRERSLAPPEKIRVIPYAPDSTPEIWELPDSSRNSTVESMLRSHDPLLITIGTLDPRKDPATARRAFIQFRETHPSAAPQLGWAWIGGPGPMPDPTSQAVIGMAEEMGFFTTGSIPNALARRMIARSAALVTCSHAEGFGIPLAEALAAGTPIIASDTSIHREVAGDAALYFPVGDAGALSESIQKFLSDPELAASLRRNAIARAQKFTWENAAKQTLEGYRGAAKLHA